MLHSVHVTFPYGQTEATATFRRFKVNRGIIHQIFVTFPPGCCGLVKFRIYHEGHPILPSTKTEYIYGDDYTFPFFVFHPILTEPQLITIEGWNEDSVYNHTLQFLFSIVDKKYIMPVGSTEGIIESMKSLFYPQVMV